jgi:hypothetical protein
MFKQEEEEESILLVLENKKKCFFCLFEKLRNVFEIGHDERIHPEILPPCSDGYLGPTL